MGYNKWLLQKINLSKPIFERNTQEGINKNQDLLDNYKIPINESFEKYDECNKKLKFII